MHNSCAACLAVYTRSSGNGILCWDFLRDLKGYYCRHHHHRERVHQAIHDWLKYRKRLIMLMHVSEKSYDGNSSLQLTMTERCGHMVESINCNLKQNIHGIEQRMFHMTKASILQLFLEWSIYVSGILHIKWKITIWNTLFKRVYHKDMFPIDISFY